MTQNLLPVPGQLPPVPDSIEQTGHLGTIGNQHAGCGMFGRVEGSTLTELQRCCEAHLITYIGKKMPLSTAVQTKAKLHHHWRWRNSGVCCRAIETGETRGGELVYRIIEDATTDLGHSHTNYPSTSTASAGRAASAKGSGASQHMGRPGADEGQGLIVPAPSHHPRQDVLAILAAIPSSSLSRGSPKAIPSEQQAFEEEYMTSTEAMQFLSISRAGFLYGRRSGKLPEPLVLNNGKLIVWKRSEVIGPLLTWKQSRKVSR